MSQTCITYESHSPFKVLLGRLVILACGVLLFSIGPKMPDAAKVPEDSASSISIKSKTSMSMVTSVRVIMRFMSTSAVVVISPILMNSRD